MKKLLLLFLAVAGMVTTASAQTYILAGDPAITNGNLSGWSNSEGSNIMTETSTGSGVYYLKVENCTLAANTNYNCAPLIKDTWTRPFNNSDDKNDWSYGITVQYPGSYDIYYYLNTNINSFDVFATPMLRSNVMNSGNGNWDWAYDASADFTQDSPLTWHYDISADNLANNNSFVIYVKTNSRSYYAWPASSLTLPASVTSGCYFNTESNATNTEHRWSFTKPDYTFEKVRIALTYDPSVLNFTMTVTPYVSKTISDKGVATFGCAVPVDFSKAIPATDGKSFTAKKGVVSGKTISWTEISTLDGGKGALLEGDADTYSIPVAVSGDATDNDFVAITSTQQITETMGGKYAYILTEVGGKLGFYKPADNGGSWCAAGTAYLATGTASARGFFPLWDDATAIEAAQQEQIINGEAYNLAGQRVAQPSKGLYIVNGKKVILK